MGAAERFFWGFSPKLQFDPISGANGWGFFNYLLEFIERPNGRFTAANPGFFFTWLSVPDSQNGLD